jgi:hypothetical protein
LSENDSAVSKFIRPQCRAVRDARAVSPSTSPFREARPT